MQIKMRPLPIQPRGRFRSLAVDWTRDPPFKPAGEDAAARVRAAVRGKSSQGRV